MSGIEEFRPGTERSSTQPWTEDRDGDLARPPRRSPSTDFETSQQRGDD